MTLDHPKSTLKIAGHPIHPVLIPFPVAFFVGALAADIAFLGSHDRFFARGALWLIGSGLVMAALAALAGLTDFLGDRRIRELGDAWQHMIGNVVAVLVSLFSFYLRSTNGADAAYPLGLILSAVVVLILLFTGWKGWEMVYRRHVGIADD